MGMKMLARYSWLRITFVGGCCKYSSEHMVCLKIRKQIESLSKFTCLDKTLTCKKTVNGVLHDIVHQLFTKAFLPSKCHTLSWYMHNFIYISKNSVAFLVSGFTKLSNSQ